MFKKGMFLFIPVALSMASCQTVNAYCELEKTKTETMNIQKEKDQCLYKAMRKEELSKFEELIEIGANPNFYYQGETWDNRGGIMELAVMHHNDKFLKNALRYGGDPNALTRSQTESLIFVALGVNDLTKVKILIDNGADINFRDSMSRTPFHAALMSNAYSIALYLYNRQADIETEHKFGATPKDTLLKYGGLGVIRTEADRKALYDLYEIFGIEPNNNSR